MDKSWMRTSRTIKQYIDGVEAFIKYAVHNLQKMRNIDPREIPTDGQTTVEMVNATKESFDKEDLAKFQELLLEAEKPLYKGCPDFTKLSAILKLLNLKGKISRWKVDNKTHKVYENIPAKVMWYFPTIPRLQRLFKLESISEDLRWHATRRITYGVLRHPADSQAWRTIDEKFPEIAKDPRNLRLGISADGVDVNSGTRHHSVWPVLSVIYNLPPWLCMKRKFTMLSSWGIKPELFARQEEDKTTLPPAGYTLTNAEKDIFCETLSNIRNELAWGEKYEFQNYKLKCREIKINNLNLELEKVVKERDELKLKIEKWEESSKNLDELLNSQMSARDKTGLGYGTQLNQMSNNSETDSEISLSIFYVRSSDEENTQANDMFSKADGFHAVPPPKIGNFVATHSSDSYSTSQISTSEEIDYDSPEPPKSLLKWYHYLSDEYKDNGRFWGSKSGCNESDVKPSWKDIEKAKACMLAKAQASEASSKAKVEACGSKAKLQASTKTLIVKSPVPITNCVLWLANAKTRDAIKGKTFGVKIQ
ncbi:hypothetical protein Tco_1229088 [Tanacetum coccineum]